MANNDFLPITRPSIDEATIAAVGDVLRSGWITSGPKVRAFEAQLSEMFGGRPVRTMSSATGAMEIALALAGIGPGDEVITTPLSWVATANVVLRAGARPVFVDCDARTRNIDLALVEAAITPRTRALLPVDLAGLPVDRDRLYEIARAHKLRVIEDAAQSMGANWAGRAVGAGGDLVSISFHANKNITSAEGGCLVLNDEEEARRCELWRLQGARRQGDSWDGMDVTLAGGKHNLTDIAACIGLGQLPHLAAFTARRRELARRYFARFDRSLGFELPLEDYAQCNWHMFQVLLPAGAVRKVFISAMREAGIGVGVHYPAIHLFTLFRQLGHREGEFPQAERIGDRTVSLPMFPAMADADVDRVLAALPSALDAALAAGTRGREVVAGARRA
ncbi:MAG TPA: DegT/DnrJ/EryC1/StrS aminotransferase family protein [Rhodanobacteraceae bacterium]|nr:DegT/DnrJ/EryC1/StrS aminotransferase family protein [Rhodanobacteraceae bacterium]